MRIHPHWLSSEDQLSGCAQLSPCVVWNFETDYSSHGQVFEFPCLKTHRWELQGCPEDQLLCRLFHSRSGLDCVPRPTAPFTGQKAKDDVGNNCRKRQIEQACCFLH